MATTTVSCERYENWCVGCCNRLIRRLAKKFLMQLWRLHNLSLNDSVSASGLSFLCSSIELINNIYMFTHSHCFLHPLSALRCQNGVLLFLAHFVVHLLLDMDVGQIHSHAYKGVKDAENGISAHWGMSNARHKHI